MKGTYRHPLCPITKYLFLSRLDADAILSFSQKATVVGEVATGVVNFALNWASSYSTDYDVLVSNSFTAKWAKRHRPVISQGVQNHTLYTGHSYLEPHGLPIRHQNHARKYLRPSVQKTKVMITCKQPGCGATCVIPKFETDKRTALGHERLVKVTFDPGAEAEAQWKRPLLKNAPKPPPAAPDVPGKSVPKVTADPSPPSHMEMESTKDTTRTMDRPKTGQATVQPHTNPPLLKRDGLSSTNCGPHSTPTPTVAPRQPKPQVRTIATQSITPRPQTTVRRTGFRLPPASLPSHIEALPPGPSFPTDGIQHVRSTSRLTPQVLPPDSPSPSPSPVVESPALRTSDLGRQDEEHPSLTIRLPASTLPLSSAPESPALEPPALRSPSLGSPDTSQVKEPLKLRIRRPSSRPVQSRLRPPSPAPIQRSRSAPSAPGRNESGASTSQPSRLTGHKRPSTTIIVDSSDSDSKVEKSVKRHKQGGRGRG